MAARTVKFPADLQEKVEAIKGRKSFGLTVVELVELGLRVEERQRLIIESVNSGRTQIDPSIFPGGAA